MGKEAGGIESSQRSGLESISTFSSFSKADTVSSYKQ
jgi:hypothetical protein